MLRRHRGEHPVEIIDQGLNVGLRADGGIVSGGYAFTDYGRRATCGNYDISKLSSAPSFLGEGRTARKMRKSVAAMSSI